MALENIRLNGITKDVFNATAADFGGSAERAHIVNASRMLMVERAGMDENNLRTAENKSKRFNSVLGDMTYAEANKKVQSNLLLYCAKQVSNFTGEAVPANFDEFVKNQRRYLSDSNFLRVLAGIITEIVTPVLPATMSGAMEPLKESPAFLNFISAVSNPMNPAPTMTALLAFAKRVLTSSIFLNVQRLKTFSTSLFSLGVAPVAIKSLS